MSEHHPEPNSARPLDRLEILHGLRVATWEGAFSNLWLTLTSGIFLTGFALWLGAGNGVIGLVTSIPTFAGLIQLVSSYYTEKLPSRKKFTATFSITGRLLWIPIAALPFLLPHPVALVGFLLLYSISYALLNAPVPAYMAWMQV